MNLVRRMRRALFAVLLVTAALAAIGLIAIQAQQWYLRYRAERLLADIRGLELRKSTFADAQRIYAKWWKGASYKGNCTSARCDFEIQFDDFVFHHTDFFWRHQRLFRWYQGIGGHPASVIAGVSVRDGAAWGKGFVALVEAPPYPPFWGPEQYTLIGSAWTVSRFRYGFVSGRVPADLLRHPHHQVRKAGICSGCRLADAKFTPYADRADVDRYMNLDLSCLTRMWHSCRTEADIMPALQQEPMPGESHSQSPAQCGPKTTELLGRDAEDVAIVVVTGKPVKAGRPATRVRLLEMLKLNPHNGAQPETALSRPIVSDQLNEFKVGDRVLLFFDSYEVIPLELYECGVVPMSEQNLGLAKTGIAQDWDRGRDID